MHMIDLITVSTMIRDSKTIRTFTFPDGLARLSRLCIVIASI